MKINYEKIGGILRLLRMSNSLSQEKLGAALGFKKTKVSDLEIGNQVISYEDLNKYSKFFHIPIIYITCNEDIDFTKPEVERINQISENIKKYKYYKLCELGEKEILEKILNKYEIDLKDKSTLNKILEIINKDKPDKPGDTRIVKRQLKNGIKFKHMEAFIFVLNINVEELFRQI